MQDSDLILNQLPMGVFGFDLAERYQIPHIMVAVIPMTETAAFPLPLIANRNFGPVLNRVSYASGRFMMGRLLGFDQLTRQFRALIGLPLLPEAERHHRLRSQTVIHGFSPAIVSSPSDWGPNIHTVGYWRTPTPDYQPDAALSKFLDSGEPPIFVGFGSMPLRDPRRILNTIIKTLQHTGQRGIIGSGWSHFGDILLPPTLHHIGYIPYSWLFPRMKAVVHHGGSGTTGDSVHAGVPTIIVSFTADQPYWGRRLSQLGVGVGPIPIGQLTTTRLTEAIQKAIHTPQIRQQSAALGATLRAESGIERAIALIEAQTPAQATR